MPTDLESAHHELMQTVRARANAHGEWLRTSFVAEFMERLVAAGEFQDWIPCYHEGRGTHRRLMTVDGYSDDELELDGTLYVVVADLRDGDTIEALSTGDIRTTTGRAVAFVADACAGELEDLEPSLPTTDLVHLIQSRRDALKVVRVVLLSNALAGTRARTLDERSIDGLSVVLDVWDLGRLQRSTVQGGREPLDLDLLGFAPQGLPALSASIGETGYRSFLCVVPGTLLANVYELHGSRLLEGNVRAFLSARGNVNKGLRRTIMDAPDRFFAFNNGITATAADVGIEVRGGVSFLTRILDLQIVNGGQTTASLYNARKRDGASLDAVFVQMKLSVLPADAAAEMVPEIARFANTQNKVSEADLFANHPFHRRIEDLSRRIWAPPRSGLVQTHWFYERARAQYQTELTRRSPAKQREFEIQNPKDQLLTKTDVAKYENAWAMLPQVVSRGAQKNFLVYAERMHAAWETRDTEFNELWFKHLAAKAIVFRATEKLVSNASWYQRAYRANIVAYAVSRLLALVADRYPSRTIDLDRIWSRQHLSETIEKQLDHIGELVQEVLVAPPAAWSNVTEWAKKDECWRRIQSANVRVVDGLEGDLQERDTERQEMRDARVQQKDDQAISAVIEASRLAAEGFFRRAASWPRIRTVASAEDFRALYAISRQQTPQITSDKTAARLLDLARRLREEGFK